MVKDALDELIEAKRQECESLRDQCAAIGQRLAASEHDLEVLEHAAALRPNVTFDRRSTPDGATGSHKGRQPGAISREWREILRRVAIHYPEGATPDDIAAYGATVGLHNLSPRDARQRAKKYVSLGYFEASGDRYRVTAQARERFGAIGEEHQQVELLPMNETEALDDAA
jgi:hypothetical protein